MVIKENWKSTNSDYMLVTSIYVGRYFFAHFSILENMFQYVVPLAHSFYKIDWLRVKLKYDFVWALSKMKKWHKMTILSEKMNSFWNVFKSLQNKQISQLTNQKLSQMSKSILQKEWSYVVWDESADIWCCFSSFYSVQQVSYSIRHKF